MKGFINKSVLTLGCTGALAALQGCECYHNIVDPCYPERYNYAARQELKEALGAQVYNGHVLEQTIWNHDFEAGTDRLTPGGMDHLAYLARRRPAVDPVIYLQTAQDVAYDQGDATKPAKPNTDKFIESRNDLNSRRTKSIEAYLAAQTSGRDVKFEVKVHDPPEVGIAATYAGQSAARMNGSAEGTRQTGGGGQGIIGLAVGPAAGLGGGGLGAPPAGGR
jgi:hypothetical protein